MEETNEQYRARVQSELDRPLLPALVSRRDGQDYMAIPQVITQANRIFGHGNWSSEVRSHTALTNEKGLVTGYKAIVRVSVPKLAATYEGVGYEQMTKRRNDDAPLQTPRAHDTAMKGAESDGVKRAFRYFGDQFGNALYEKDDERKRVVEFVAKETRRGSMTLDDAEDRIMRPFRRVVEVPISMALKAYYAARNAAAKAKEKNQGEAADADEDRFPEIEEPIDRKASELDPDEEDPEHDDRPARRRRDPFRSTTEEEAEPVAAD